MEIHDLVETIAIQVVTLFQGPPLHGPLMPVGQIVEDNWAIAGKSQRLTGVTAHIARATGHQNGPGRSHDSQSFRNAAICVCPCRLCLTR